MGVVPRVQSKFSRAPHARRGKKLLQDLQTQESAAMKRAMVRFRGAREKGAMAFVERRHGALSLTIGYSTRHWLDPFVRVKSSLYLKTHGPSDRELANKMAD